MPILPLTIGIYYIYTMLTYSKLYSILTHYALFI